MIAQLMLVTFAGISSIQAPSVKEVNSVRALVIVSGAPIAKTRLDQIFKQSEFRKIHEQLGTDRFRPIEKAGYRFLLDEAALGVAGLKGRRVMLEVFAGVLRKGRRSVILSELPSQEADALRSVVREQLPFINPGMRHLAGNPELKITLEPVVTAWFEGGGRKERLSAGSILKGDLLTTKKGATVPPSTASEYPLPVSPQVENALFCYFSPDFQRPTHRIAALHVVDALLKEIEATELALFDSAFRSTRELLFSNYAGEVGASVPPVSEDTSKLSPALQNGFNRNLSLLYRRLGFDSMDQAGTWLINSRMSHSNSYINFVIAGEDNSTGKRAIMSLILQRP